MLDRKLIIDQVDLVRTNCQARGVQVDLDRLIELELQRKTKLAEAQELNRQANEVSKSIGGAQTPGSEATQEQGRHLRELKDAAQAEHDRLDQQVHACGSRFPI